MRRMMYLVSSFGISSDHVYIIHKLSFIISLGRKVARGPSDLFFLLQVRQSFKRLKERRELRQVGSSSLQTSTQGQRSNLKVRFYLNTSAFFFIFNPENGLADTHAVVAWPRLA